MISVRRCVGGFTLLGFAGFLLFAAGTGAARQLSFSVDLSREEISFRNVGEYDLIRIVGCDLTDAVGEPQLPAKLVHVVLPSGARVSGLAVVRVQSQEVPGEFLISPAQNPEILPIPGFTMKKAPFAPPKPSVYESLEPYPRNPVELMSVGNMGSYRIASILVYPFQYIGKERRLIYYSKIECVLECQPSKQPFLQGGSHSMEKIVKGLVLNPDAVEAKSSQQAECEYLIVTSPEFASNFQVLADWKTQKGIPARVVTTDSIYENSEGVDEAEKVRNFIKHAYQNLGTQWVLLGGDAEIVPDRVAYAMTCEYYGHPDEDSLRADLYYSDLDGTWNSNGNGIYGEIADSVDLYPEVFVGRAPASTKAEARYFATKVAIYEKDPPTDYQLDILFLGAILWDDPWPYTDAGVGKNIIDSLYVPPRFDPITKLYESLGNESYTSVMDALNEGQNLINHDGHGWINYMGVGEGHLDGSDMDALRNGYHFGILYSIGCWVGAFHYDAISEHFVNNPLGGGVAFIANSSYGWGSPGNPGFGYSDRFDHTFYEKLFLERINRIGAAIALSKAHYAPRSRAPNVYRWHQYQLNLLGDPEMPIWTDLPAELTVSFPESVCVGTSRLLITVTSDGPVVGALVCVTKEGEVYERDYTGFEGKTSLDISPTAPGFLTLTVTAVDHLPSIDSIAVYSTGSYVGYLDHELGGGNGDQEMNPGEVLDIGITIQNFGNDLAQDVSAILSSTDPSVILTDSSCDFGSLGAGDTATGIYSFSISSDVENGHAVFFTLDVTDGVKNWQNRFSVAVATPLLSIWKHAVDDSSGGNGNGISEPGETLDISVWVRNAGLGLSREVACSAGSNDPHIHFVDTTAAFGDVPTLSTASGDFVCAVDEMCPTPHFAELVLRTSTSDGYLFSDTVVLVIGETGFSDDMEGGADRWSHGGIPDGWHLTSHRAHSGQYSWYCGNEGSWSYDNGMASYLESSPIVVIPGTELSFWHWYDVAIYGVDGLHVEILHGAVSDTLDFIGSGGALDSLLMGNPWVEDVYDLSHYPTGDTVTVRFSFVSDDDDVAEGFYIDDVRVGPKTSSEPDIPVLLYPPNSSVTKDKTPTFRWSSVAGPEGFYTLQYSTDQGFLNGVTTHEMLLNPIYTVPFTAPLDTGIYYWRVKTMDEEGMESDYQLPFQFALEATVGGIREIPLPRAFAVSCVPNPFVGATTIKYQLPSATEVMLTIYDITGRVVRTLVDKRESAGYHHVAWDGKNDGGEAAGVGIYFCTLRTDMHSAVKKLILLK
jgi:hypothetical protein